MYVSMKYINAFDNVEIINTVGPVLIARTNANYEFFLSTQIFDSQCILLIAHPYVQFAQTQLLNSQCS